MATPQSLASLLQTIDSESSFIQSLLVEGLGWNIDSNVEQVDQIAFDWTAEELQAEGLNHKLVEGRTWDEHGFYAGNTTYFIPTNEKWLAGLLNSQTIEWFYSNVSNRVRGGYLRAFSDYMKQIPISLAPPEK